MSGSSSSPSPRFNTVIIDDRATTWTNFGLDTAAGQPIGAFDTAGAAAVEMTRAMSVETTLTTAIANTTSLVIAETTRAEAVETILSSSITSINGTLSTAITAERDRAEAAEAALGLSANNGVMINAGTISIVNDITLTGTVDNTITIGPASGTSDVIVNMPTIAGTVTLVASPQFKRQKIVLDIVYGATISTPVLNSGFVFSNTPSVYVPGTVADSVDRLELISPDNTHWVVLSISQGSPI